MFKKCEQVLSKTKTVLSAVSRAQGTSELPPISRLVESETKPFEDIPGPRSYPIVGSIPYMALKSVDIPIKFARNLEKDYGNIIKVNIPVLGDLVYILDVAHQKKMLSLDGPMPDMFGFDPFYELRSNDLAEYFKETRGLLSNGKEWQEFRQKVQQDMMRPRSALHYINDIDNVAATMVEKIGKEKTENFDLENILQEYALESINIIFLGKKLGVLEGNPEGAAMIKNTRILLTEIAKASKLPKKIFGYELPWHKRLVKANKELLEISLKNIKEAVDQLDLEKDESVLASLVRKCSKNSAIPTIMAADALFAGIDTTSLAINFLLYHLATNEDAQQQLYEEIIENTGPDGRVTEACLQKMRYLKACVKESMRLMPVASATGRRTQVEMELGGYKIPAGTIMIRFGMFNSNDEKHFDEPEKFLPERWIRGGPSRHKADSFANLPFGHGPRACIGQRFANMEIQVAVANIIKRYDLKHTGKDFYLKQATILQAPSNPIMLNLVERN